VTTTSTVGTLTVESYQGAQDSSGTGRGADPNETTKHPHAAAGSPKGGQFTSKPAGGGKGRTAHRSAGAKKKTVTHVAAKPTAHPAAPAPQKRHRTMHRGESGPDVAALNAALARLDLRGPNGEKLNLSDQYGPDTEAAVMRAQQMLGLKPTGRAGSGLMRRLNDAAKLSPCLRAKESTAPSRALLLWRVAEAWDEKAHPRVPGHHAGGGEFTKAGAVLHALVDATQDEHSTVKRPTLLKRAKLRGIETRGHSDDQIRHAIRMHDAAAKAHTPTPEAQHVARVQAARPLADLARDIDAASVIENATERSDVIGEHITGAEQAGELTSAQADKLRSTLAGEGGASKVKAAVTRMNKANGVTLIGNADKTTTFDPELHKPLVHDTAADSIAPGTRVRVVRQGHSVDDVTVEKAVVSPVGRPARKVAAPKKAAVTSDRLPDEGDVDYANRKRLEGILAPMEQATSRDEALAVLTSAPPADLRWAAEQLGIDPLVQSVVNGPRDRRITPAQIAQHIVSSFVFEGGGRRLGWPGHEAAQTKDRPGLPELSPESGPRTSSPDWTPEIAARTAELQKQGLTFGEARAQAHREAGPAPQAVVAPVGRAPRKAATAKPTPAPTTPAKVSVPDEETGIALRRRFQELVGGRDGVTRPGQQAVGTARAEFGWGYDRRAIAARLRQVADDLTRRNLLPEEAQVNVQPGQHELNNLRDADVARLRRLAAAVEGEPSFSPGRPAKKAAPAKAALPSPAPSEPARPDMSGDREFEADAEAQLARKVSRRKVAASLRTSAARIDDHAAIRYGAISSDDAPRTLPTRPTWTRSCSARSSARTDSASSLTSSSRAGDDRRRRHRRRLRCRRTRASRSASPTPSSRRPAGPCRRRQLPPVQPMSWPLVTASARWTPPA
jgi:hypothetical protein